MAQPARRLCSAITLAAAALTTAIPFGARSQTVAAPQMDAATIRARLEPHWAKPDRVAPSDATVMDEMLRQGQFGPLTARLRSAHTANDIALDMDWEQTHIFNGAGFVIAYSYMFDLWRLGVAEPAPVSDQLKQSAAMMFLYSLDLADIDGGKCNDPSAAGHRIDQLIFQNKDMAQYIRSLPRTTRMTLGSISLDIETATASLRGDDVVLCSGGMAQVSEGLKAQGDKPLPQLPPASGALGSQGKTYVVPTPSNYTPKFTSRDIWGPKQAKARQAMPATLTQFLTVPSDTPAPPTKP